jgi:hypothetical protein
MVRASLVRAPDRPHPVTRSAIGEWSSVRRTQKGYRLDILAFSMDMLSHVPPAPHCYRPHP